MCIYVYVVLRRGKKTPPYRVPSSRGMRVCDQWETGRFYYYYYLSVYGYYNDVNATHDILCNRRNTVLHNKKHANDLHRCAKKYGRQKSLPKRVPGYSKTTAARRHYQRSIEHNQTKNWRSYTTFLFDNILKGNTNIQRGHLDNIYIYIIAFKFRYLAFQFCNSTQKFAILSYGIWPCRPR